MEENKLDALKNEFHQEYPEFISFLSVYGRPILTVVLAVVVVTLGIRLVSSRKEASLTNAAVAFAQAQSITDLENVISDYGSSPSAPLAYVSLARAYFDTGDYDMALSKYMEFQSKFPEHPMAVSVELNRVACLEARGQIQEAQMGYEEFIKKHDEHYLASEAKFGMARCFEKQGLWAKARTIYEDYMVANPAGAWFARAEEALDVADRELKASQEPVERETGSQD
jgi:tetratricopeptide (TPR) repeat protein